MTGQACQQHSAQPRLSLSWGLDQSGRVVLQLGGRYVRWVEGQSPSTLKLVLAVLITVVITAPITFAVDHGIPAVWKVAFPATPATKVVPFEPLVRQIHGPHGVQVLRVLKPRPKCYTSSLRSNSIYAWSCVDRRGLRHDPCFNFNGPQPVPPNKSPLVLCYDAPWEPPDFTFPASLGRAPTTWSKALRSRPLADLPFGLALANGLDCVYTPYPELERHNPPDPEGITYECYLPAESTLGNRPIGYIKTITARFGRVWKVSYLPAGSFLGAIVDVRTVWTSSE